jgi:hypothetical protein
MPTGIVEGELGILAVVAPESSKLSVHESSPIDSSESEKTELWSPKAFKAKNGDIELIKQPNTYYI